MSTLKLKASDNNGGNCTLASPFSKVGPSEDGRVIIYAVEEIPYGVSAHQVILMFNQSCQICGHIFRFSDLGRGAILWGKK